MSSYYKELQAMYKDLEKWLQSGAEINIDKLILEMTKKHAVSDKAIQKRLERYERAGMIEFNGGSIQWTA